MNTADYRGPTVTVDSVTFRINHEQLEVLLIRRSREPFKNSLALPGSYNAAGETTFQALERTLRHKAGLDLAAARYTEQLYTFDTIARDPRGHAISVTYMSLGRSNELVLSHTVEEPQFYAVANLPELAYDHDEIIDYAHTRLRHKITYTNAVFALLANEFTFSQLQIAYEAILGKSLDKRNFRKKIMSLDLIRETGNMHRDGAHRPAKLYTFHANELQTLHASFE